MVLRRDQQLPVVVRPRIVEMRSGVPDEVAEDVLLELHLRVRLLRSAEPIERREERPRRVERAVIDTCVAPASGLRIRLARRDDVDEGGD